MVCFAELAFRYMSRLLANVCYRNHMSLFAVLTPNPHKWNRNRWDDSRKNILNVGNAVLLPLVIRLRAFDWDWLGGNVELLVVL